MQKELSNHSNDFKKDFLATLSKIFNSMSPIKINEVKRGSIHYFQLGFTTICIYNAYQDGVQLIFNKTLLEEHFDVALDFSENSITDWKLVISIIVDIVEKIEDGRSVFSRAAKTMPALNRALFF